MIYTIAAFYRFVSLPDPAALREQLRSAFASKPEDPATDLCGTILITPEGINGTMAGSAATIDRLLATLEAATGLPHTDVKFATTGERPFGRLKLQLKKEIIAFRKATVDPSRPGQYIDPQHWNDLIADPDILLLDTRNEYETEIGMFAGAVDPHINTFSEFVTWVRANLDPAKTPKVAMYCTGGIRCEKASAFMLQEGFQQVYHLKGGILKYMETVPEPASRWNGTCFVFDRRTAVSHADLQNHADLRS